jgi:hypothetical protein
VICLKRYGPLHNDLQPLQSLGDGRGFGSRMFEALAKRSPQSLQLIDSSIFRVHQHAAVEKKGGPITPLAVSRGGS